MGTNLLMQATEFKDAVDWATKLTGFGVLTVVTLLWLMGKIVTRRELDRAVADGERWRMMAERTQDDNEQLVSQNERLENLLDKAFKAVPASQGARHDGPRRSS